MSSTLVWRRSKRCDNSGPDCPEVATDGNGTRFVRNSRRPEIVVEFDRGDWEVLIESIRDEEF